jgi:predicted lipoprotein with Yx(FWY)xxD motif
VKLNLIKSAAIAPLFVAACAAPGYSQSSGSGSPYGSPPAQSPAATSAPVATAPPTNPGTTIATYDSHLGKILVDASGRTVYLFEADMGTTSSCYDACAQYWPPVLTQGAPQAGAGANASLLGTTRRKDGSMEITYAGHPLYYFLLDKQANDTNGQGLNNFGGGWDVVTPAGARVEK